MRGATLVELLTLDPTPQLWDRIRKRLDKMDGEELREAVRRVAIVVKAWPDLLSRPPLKTWRQGDPRLQICRVARETNSYNDYILALAQIKTRDGRQAVQLERQFTGGVQSRDGKEMQIGVSGSADLKGGLILEWEVNDRWRSIGARLEVEVKAPGGNPSKNQLDRQRAFLARNECLVIAYSPDEAVERVAAWKSQMEYRLSDRP